ncbi:beta strand repeat-containing protein [Bartonella machadoae]|uniref:beta strand repeat-containing protein n=1 Tax=Bartonella machadoae TaxID=2893471 RepID=UPI001F4CC090|nr:hypothetical protein [Bartonella machadoae]UNE53549.1 hypothetical protein LNM86_07705 [Bartonella machadoae]
MYKKHLLSYAATAAIILFNIQFNAQAGILEVPEGEKTAPDGATYEIIHAKGGGKITGKSLTIVGNKDINSNSNTSIYAVTVEGDGSVITLSDGTKIKGDNDSVISLGVEAKDGANFNMTGGNIEASQIGAHFNNNNKESTLDAVTISSVAETTSSGKDDKPLRIGIIADENGTVTLKNVKVSQTNSAVIADYNSTVTVTGGSFDAKNATIIARNSSTIDLKDIQNISSGNAALAATTKSTITMDKGTVTGKEMALVAETGGHITATDATLKAKGSGWGAFANGSNSVVELLGNTIIDDSKIGLEAQDGAVIKMAKGTITASQHGAIFSNTQSEENKLENVTISSGKDDALLRHGVEANQNGTVTLKDVTVTQADNAIFAGDEKFADDKSIITVSGGSFDAKQSTIFAQNGSTIILNNVKKITSSNDFGLAAKDNGVISMIGGDAGTTITDSASGAIFSNTKSKDNKLENVTISKGKSQLKFGVVADKSNVTLKDVTVSQAAENAIFADDHSTITVSGGSFDATSATIFAGNGSTIDLQDIKKITSSDNVGLYAKESGSTITMAKGSVTGKGTTLFAENGGHIKVTDVTLVTLTATIDGNDIGVGAIAKDSNSVIELLGDTKINDSIIGLQAQKDGAISMTGGKITASQAGAVFFNSKRTENHLENVEISSSKNDELLTTGITASENSTVNFKNVSVTQAKSAIVADKQSTITVSGGSFDATAATIGAENGSTIILTENAQITSSDDSGLVAQNNGAISMNGGSIKASYNGAAFENSNRNENHLENVTISSGKNDALLHYGINADKKVQSL